MIGLFVTDGDFEEGQRAKTQVVAQQLAHRVIARLIVVQVARRYGIKVVVHIFVPIRKRLKPLVKKTSAGVKQTAWKLQTPYCLIWGLNNVLRQTMETMHRIPYHWFVAICLGPMVFMRRPLASGGMPTKYG
ncbi:MAG: hypothetical protein Q8N13_14130 [Acidovorax sp.]|nr:hypothetical protein [Acidovorax sp.]